MKTNNRYPQTRTYTHTQKSAAKIIPARPRLKTGCIIPAAAPVDGVVDARVEDEVPELVPPVEVVLVPVRVPVAVVAVVVSLMLAEVTVEFTATDVITTDEDDDREETEGKFVLMTVGTGD